MYFDRSKLRQISRKYLLYCAYSLFDISKPIQQESGYRSRPAFLPAQSCLPGLDSGFF